MRSAAGLSVRSWLGISGWSSGCQLLVHLFLKIYITLKKHLKIYVLQYDVNLIKKVKYTCNISIYGVFQVASIIWLVAGQKWIHGTLLSYQKYLNIETISLYQKLNIFVVTSFP